MLEVKVSQRLAFLQIQSRCAEKQRKLQLLAPAQVLDFNSFKLRQTAMRFC